MAAALAACAPLADPSAPIEVAPRAAFVSLCHQQHLVEVVEPVMQRIAAVQIMSQSDGNAGQCLAVGRLVARVSAQTKRLQLCFKIGDARRPCHRRSGCGYIGATGFRHALGKPRGDRPFSAPL